ncbi:hypothetical protein HII17_15505 [Thalassotalea sp. M1531]|uniref:Uncharacterized protein n=1 Tax=Thalassotalea algicola TaxID=2716224 RepID=A0A7Y0LEA7_9GAMM|nr:hypothetical protein [Thalassotalea algicola]NMP32964.1 hypothetical protein [Thalassotalea algicola]
MAPKVEITFPISSAKTDASTLTIKGTATEDDGIADIVIEGVSADISQTNSTIQWQAKIPVKKSFKQNINIQTQSSNGHRNNKAGQFSLSSLDLPYMFTIDNENHRLIGYSSGIMVLNLSDGTASTLSVGNISGSHITYNNSLSLAITASSYGGSLKASAVSLTSNSGVSLFNYDMKQNNPEIDYSLLEDMLHVEPQNATYFLVRLRSARTKLAIYKYSFDNDKLSLYMSTDKLDDFYHNGAQVGQGRLAFFNGLLYFTGLDDLILTIANEGETPELAKRTYNSPLKSINIHSITGLAYLIDSSGVIELNIATGELTRISNEADEANLKIGYFRHSQIDEQNNELMVLDLSTDTLIEINLSTGERKETFKNGIGEGRKLTTPTDIAYSKKNKKLYIGESESKMLYSINLSTGDRSPLSNLSVYGAINDILIDDESQQLYVLLSNNVHLFDLATKTITELINVKSSNYYRGTFTGFDLDKANNKLLITDTENSSLMALDLSTKVLNTLTSGFGNNKDGNSSTTDVKINSTNNIAYVLSQSLGAIFSVNLSNNDKSIILDSCLSSYNEEILAPGDWGVEQLFLDEDNQVLYVVGSASLAIYNIESNTCAAPRAGLANSFFDITSTSKDQLVGTYFNVVKQLDLKNGEHVIISK